MGGSWTSGGLRRALRARIPNSGVVRALVRAPLLILLATCQVDKLTNTPPPLATLTLAPDKLQDSVALGSTRFADDSLVVANAGQGTLSWSARLAQGESWLAIVSATSGTAPAKLRVAFNPAGLPSGVYRDTVVVSAENAMDSPGRVPVEFTVHACMPVAITLDAALADSLTNRDCTAPHRPTGFARVYAFSANAGDSVSVVMTSAPVDAYVVLDSSIADGVSALAQNDRCTTGADACLRYQRLPPSGSYWIEATSAGAGQTGAFALSVTRPRAPASPASLAQLRKDSLTAIATGGGTDQDQVVLRGLVTDPDAGDSLRLEVEVRPVGTPFTGTPTQAGDRVAIGQPGFVAVPGLANNTAYHWQARTTDQTGRASGWTAFGGNTESAPDFSTNVAVPPTLPTALGQYQSDGTTAIAVGGVAAGRSVAFTGTVSDPNPGDQLRLEVEVETVGTVFTGTANASSAAVANGGTATAFIAGLRDSTSYHWQARTVDQTGRASAWTPFGSNPEQDADFRVAIAAAQLVFTVQPGTATAGSAITPAVQVTAQDALGNPVTSFNANVTVSIGTNPAGGTLSGTTTVTAVNGVATFPDLRIDKTGAGYTLQAATTKLTGTSAGFTVIAAAATHLVFTAQPSTTAAGATVTPAVQVTARDAFDNTATGFTGNVTVSLAQNPGGGTLSGTATVAAVGGVASFTTLSINKTGSGYTLGATAGGLTGGQSNAFDVIPATAARLVFTVQPSGTTAGAAITPAVQVTAQDAQGNTVTGFTANITVAIAANAGGGTLAGTTTVAAVSGVATFAGLSINKAGAGYTLGASAGTLTGGPSAAFDIAPGAAAQLAVTTQPTNTTAGSVITPAMKVTALDAQGNAATGFAGNVTVTLANNPGGATLSGTATMAAVAGVATFGDLSLDKAGTGYTLAAAATGLTGTTSAAFTVSPAAANKLVFTVQPSAVTAGAAIAPAVQVTAQDGLGNTVTSFTGTVTVALGNNPGNGTLSGTTAMAAVGGVATFATLSVNRTGTGYTLTAAATGLTTGSSGAFTVAPGPAATLVFTVQPTTTVAGATIAPAVHVTAQDAEGNTATQFTGNVTVALGSNAGGGTLSGTTTVAAAAGVASFATLSIDKSGTGYTLAASATGLTPAASAGFTVTPGAATQLAFTVQPANVTAGAGITPAVQVTARDALGNTATAFSGTVTLTLAVNPGAGTLSGTAAAAAVGGVASFANLSIDRTGSGYRLGATASGVTSATSAPFDVTAGAASQLVFTVQPSNATAGQTLTPAVQVTAHDAQGNTATGFTGNVTVVLGANPGGGTLAGTTTVAAVGGVATFGTLSINRAGTGYTLVASATGLGTTPSAAFDIAPGAATALAFTVQPSSATAGVAITPAVQVSAQDAQGNVVPAFSGTVTVAIAANPGGGTLSGTTAVVATSGIATFPSLSINRVGAGYTLSATAGGLTSATSSGFNITPASAAQLVFTVQPSNTVAGSTMTPAVQVTAQDGLGNTATGFSGDVVVALGANPGGGTLAGTTTVTALSGVATFPGLSVNRAGDAYTLAASAGGLSPATSGAFNVAAGTATVLVFTTQPTRTVAGAVITPAVQVTARDALGNPDPTFAGNVTVSLAANPGGGVLAGTATVAAVNGVATFANLSISRSGVGYALAAGSGGLTAGQSSAFDVVAGAATQLVFTSQPSNTGAGAAITPAVAVTAEDGLGNVDQTFTGNVIVALGANPGGGTLSGTMTVPAVGGVATFSTLAIDKVGSGYTLTATAGGGSLSGGPSAAFDVTAGTATHLVYSVQPSSTTAGSVITPAVRVTAQDAQGNPATGFTGNVTVAIGTNPGGATLSGTATVAAVAGVATFGDLSLNRTGTGYSLIAGASGLGTTASAAFDIAPAAANHLVFTVQPSSTTAGATLTPAIQVTAEDGLGNTVTGFTGTVTVALGNNPGSGTLSGTTSRAATGGVATFADLSVNRTGTGYTLTASATGLTTAGSAAFDIAAGAAARLVFTVQPTATTAGAAITPAVQVTAQDAQGNTATGFTGNVTVAIGTNPGGGTLSGTATVAATAGVATFATLSINRTGTGYTLTAAAAALPTATSAPFDVTPGAASAVAFTVQPTNVIAGAAIAPPVQVTVRDALGNTATAFSGNVIVAIGTNPASGTLSGTTGVAASGGVATFSNLSINRAAAGYTLSAAATGLAGATSNAFTVTAGAATHLVFGVQPSDAAAGAAITPAVQVAAQDGLGNTDPTFTAAVAVALGANPGSGTLSGGAGVAAVAGVATFPGLSIDRAAAGYTLTAAASGLSGGTSVPFTITPGAAALLVFSVEPTNVVAGAAISPAVQVTAQDAHGNTATGFTGSVTVAIGTNAGGGTLSGTTTTAAVAGVATFANLSIDRAGAGYTLAAAAAGPAGATSKAFNVTAGAATHLVFTVQPTSTTAGTAITPAVQVTAQDALGNTDPGYAASVTVAMGLNPGGATLSGTTSVGAVAGVATFPGLSLDKAASGYTLTASGNGLTGTSATFSIAAAAATQLVFSVEPTNVAAGTAITPAVQVTARDGFGNTATGFAGNVTVAIGTNPASGALAGTTTKAAVAGVASFSDLSIDKVGAGYTLTAAGGGLAGATSTAFDVTAGSATQLVFTVQPTTATAGAPITPAVQVTARDALGNTATGFNGNVTVALGTNPGGGTLSGTTTVAASNGVASFANLSVNRSGAGYTLTAAATGLAGATSAAFTITAGAASQLVFTVQPSNTAAGTAITPAVQVSATDALGNTDLSFTGAVAVALGTNPGSGTLSGATTLTAANGVATFPGLSIDRTGTGYTLTAAAAGVSGATSAAFNITAGAATQLVFTVQPSNAVAGATITPAVRVTALDGQGNVATGFTSNVTVAIGTNPGGGTLSGTTTVAALAGVATFSNLSINRTGTGYTLTATDGGALAGATSNPFDITPGTATQMAFTQQPTNTPQGAFITPPVQVTARDALGNPATQFTGTITLAIPTNSNPGGGTLSGTRILAAVAGVATFSDLSINNAGNGYRLRATSSGLTAVNSALFNITTVTPTQLVFTVQPSNTTAGATVTPAVQVSAEDGAGNVAIGFTGNVTVAIGTNPGGGTLSGTTTVAAVSGVATFSTLSINKVGTGYTLGASSGALAGASNGFDITGTGTVSAGQSTVAATSPIVASSGTSQSTITVTAKDGFGNPIAGATVVLAATGTGNTLTQPTAVTDANGVATGTLSSTGAQSKTVSATINSTAITQTGTVVVNPAAASAAQSTVAATSPIVASSGTSQSTITVTAKDEFGNLIQGATVALAASGSGNTLTQPGLTNASGVATGALSSTVAESKTVSVTVNATGITETAAVVVSPAALSAGQSTVAATSPIIAGAGTSTITVTAKDQFGNAISGATATLAATGSGNTLTQPVATTNAAGVTTGSLTSTVAESKTVSATINSVSVTQTATVVVTAGNVSGAQSTLAATSPIVAGSGTSTITVTAKDASGNPVGGATVILTATGTGNTLTQPSATTNASGVATGSLASTVAEAKTVTATIDGVGVAQTATVVVSAGAVSATRSLVSATSPIVSGGTSAITVTARDAFDNPIAGATVVLAATGSGNTLTQPAATTNASGVATGTLSSTVAESKTVSATINAVAITPTATVVVGPGPVSAAQSTVAATSPIVAGSGTSTITVTARDASGNPIAGATVVLAATGSGNTLTQPTATTNASGVATGSLTSSVAESKTVSATINSVAITQTATVVVTVGAVSAAQSTVAATSPITASSGASQATITVTARDGLGNPISGATVVLAATGTGNTLTQPAATTDANGVAAGTLSSTVAEAKTVSATINAVGVTQTATVVVNAAAVSAGQSTVTATSPVAAGTGTSTITVTAKDGFGNPIAGATVVLAATGTGNTLTQPSGPTNAAGVATGTLSSLVAESKMVSATVNAVAITQTATVVVEASTVSGAQSTVAATSPIAASTGTSTSTITVTAKDALGNPVPGATVVLAATGAGNSLTQPVATTNSSGVATGTLSSTLAESKTVSATINGVGVTQTATVVVNAGPAAKLALTTQPSSAAQSGVALAQQPVAQVQDANGNPVSQSGTTVTATVAPAGATPSNATATTTASGAATFSGLTLTGSAGSYTLSFAGSGLTPVTSGAIALSAGAATQLGVATEPSSSAQSGVAFAQQPVVQLRDGAGNAVSQAGVTVTAAIATGGGTLGGTLTATTNASGVATFTNLSITGTAGDRTLSFSASGLTSATSTTITITAGAATQLVVTTQPSATTQSGVAFAQQPVVQLEDASGNPVSQSGIIVTTAIATGGGTLGGTLTATTNASGVASFTNLAITGTAGDRTLTFSASGLTSATSSTVTITAGSASQLSITAEPSTTAQSGVAFAQQPVIQLRDASGNAVSQSGIIVTAAIATGGGTLGGTLTTTTNASGVASFTNLAITGTAGDRTLSFSATGLTGATSTTITITAGAATQVAVTTQPSATAQSGAAFAQQPVVQLEDASGNAVSQSGVTVTAAIATGGGTLGGTLTATTNANGVATFTNLSITGTTGDRTLSFSATGLTGATSTTITITAGAATQLAVTTQPSATAQSGVAFAQQPVIQLEDANGNPVSQSGVVVTATVSPAGATASANTATTGANGAATFAGLTLTGTTGSYTLTFGAGGLTSATSGAIALSPGAADHLTITTEPSATAQGGVALAQQPVVQLRDGAGNAVSQSGVTVTATIASGPNGASLTGATATSGSTGAASYTGLTISGPTGTYSLSFGATGVTAATSSSIALGAASTTTVITGHSPDPSVVGQAVSVTYAVTSSGGTPTGNVTVSDGTAQCTGTVAAASCTLTPTSAGAKTLVATYAGDGNFGTSTSPGVGHTVNAATTTTTVTSGAPNPSATGEVVSFGFSVTASAPGSGTPTGTVTVSDGTQSCNGSVAAGSCSITFTAAGVRSVTASYAGDGNFAASTSTSATHTVNAAGTTTTVTGHSPSPSTVGQAVAVTFTVTSSGGTPTGNVTVSDGTEQCTATVALGTCSLTPATAGIKTLTASYAGDANFTGSTSLGVSHTVNPTATTTTITSDTPDPSAVGQAVPFTFTVVATAPGSGTPTGTVMVSDGVQSCNASVAAGSCSIAFSTAGNKSVTASYVGDGNYAPSTSVAEAHAVGTAATTTAISGHTPDPSVVGQGVAVTFTVTSSGGTPTGNVTVSDGIEQCTATVAVGTCSLTPATAGTKTLTASYPGDGNFGASTSTGVTHTVNAATTTTSITGHTPDPSLVGQGINVTFTVTSTGGTPTGSVTVTDGSDSCNGTVAAGGCTLTPTTAGAKTLTASYAGDGNFATSTSTGVPHTVNPASTTTTITSDSPDPSTVGQPVTVTFTVTSTAAGTPTGTVTVTDGSAQCGGTVAAGTCTLTPTTAGAKTLAATYAGDANFSGSTSLGESHTVNPASTTTTITSDTPDPSTAGQAVTVAFSVTSTGGTPTGKVTVSDGTLSCSATVAAGQCSLTPVTVGTETLTATYAGDGNFSGSVSAGEPHTVTTGLPSGSHSSMSASPSPITASSGSSASTITVTVRDAFNNAVQGATVVLSSDGTGNTVTQPVGATDVNGQVTGTLSSTVAEVKNVSAIVNGSVPLTQGTTVTVAPAAATVLAFTSQPSTVVLLNSLGPVVVTAFDEFGNVATGFAGDVTMAIANDGSILKNATLGGTKVIAALAGVATFNDLTIDQLGTGYQLGASATGLTGASSNPFDVVTVLP